MDNAQDEIAKLVSHYVLPWNIQTFHFCKYHLLKIQQAISALFKEKGKQAELRMHVVM